MKEHDSVRRCNRMIQLARAWNASAAEDEQRCLGIAEIASNGYGCV